MSFFEQNIGTLAVALILLLIITAIIVKLMRDKKKGKHSCGSCCSCPYAHNCGKTKVDK